MAALAPYRIDAQVLAVTKNPDVRFLHCMPAVQEKTTERTRSLSDAPPPGRRVK
ncbi:hypothetical protein ACWDX6_13440 [Streptomyces sp. NPDC003027]